MGIGSGVYQTVLILHILAVIFGFGPLVLAGLYDVEASKRGRSHAAAVGEVQFAVTKVAEKIVYLVFIFGVTLVLLSDKAWDFGDFWISTAMVSFIVAMGLSHGMLIPNERRLNALRAELAELDGQQLTGLPEQEVELADRSRRSAMVGTALDLILVFILYLMVVKPGG
jgi:hypothetical protein